MHYSETDKRIFAYEVQGVPCLADPLALLDRIRAQEPDLASVVRQASQVIAGNDVLRIRLALQAQEKISLAVRATFSLQDFNPETGAGVLEHEVFSLWEKFCSYLIEAKDSKRRAADFAAVYGYLPVSLTYADYVGYMLNVERCYWWLALMTAHGVSAAMTSAELPTALFDPVAGSDGEAEELAFDANAERRFQKARQEAKATMMVGA